MIPHEQSVAPANGLDLAAVRFRLRARYRIEWLHSLRVADPAAELDSLLADRDSPEEEARWVASVSQASTLQNNDELGATEAALEEDTSSPLAQIRAVFGLSPAETDLLQACVATALDPALSRLCAFLQNDARRGYLTEEIVARLYGHGRCAKWSTDSVLFSWELVHRRRGGPGEPDALSLDPQVRDWICGLHTLGSMLSGAARLYEPVAYILPRPLTDLVEFVQRHVTATPPRRIRVVVDGARGSGRRTLAGAVCTALKLPLLLINADEIDERDWRRAYMLAQRHAYLQCTALAWYGTSLAGRTWPTALPSFPLQFAVVDQGVELPPAASMTDRRVRTPGLTIQQRCALWRAHVPASADWPEEEFRALTERYRVQAGDIVAAAAAGIETAQQAGMRVREASRGRLGNLAQLLQCTFSWDDLVVADELRSTIEDIVFEANHRAAFWEMPDAQRLFPQGQGLMALFSGPPGTGKTMAAQVMAATLGYDLFRVDLAGVVSKWVGETSQNFDRILSRAADMHAIILFDECDAIFSKRTSEIRDAQDKFVNTDAAYLLQAIESYPGTALLATNQKGNIDPAFIRRLRYVLEFAKPDATQRLQLWRKVVSGLAGEQRCAELAAGLEVLANSVEVTGAQIKFAILGGLFAARRDKAPLELHHLMRGLQRELAKEGRALGRERERMLRRGA